MIGRRLRCILENTTFMDYPRGFRFSRSDSSNHCQITSGGSHQKYYQINKGSVFLFEWMKEVGRLLGFHKANTADYNPQTDSLVEHFNRILTAMLAKTAARGGQD